MLTYILKRNVHKFTNLKPRLFIFAGQGTQQKGMLSNLLYIPQAKKQIQKYSSIIGLDFTQITTTDNSNLLNKTYVTQPLLVMSQVLHFKYINQAELIKEDYLIGHSIGEYSALCIAKSISLEQSLKLVKKRGELMQQFTLQPSGMLIVRYSDQRKQEVLKILKQCELQIACYNTPNNMNIAGKLKKLQKARQIFRKQKITCIFLPVSTAFHCQALANMMEPYRQYLSTIKFGKPVANILRNLDTNIYQQDNDIKQGLIKHLINPVKFYQSVQRIDIEVECIEVGHNQKMKKYVEQTRKKMQTK